MYDFYLIYANVFTGLKRSNHIRTTNFKHQKTHDSQPCLAIQPFYPLHPHPKNFIKYFQKSSKHPTTNSPKTPSTTTKSHPIKKSPIPAATKF